MKYQQAIAFNQSRGGTTPNMCLANVTYGFGIPLKYGSAWEAWQHTEQHIDRNLPDGVDVPVYYSYTATIDGETANYGHINVRLANGTVWSDGNIYASIDDYTSKKLPRFVGWGESVNNVAVLKQEGDDEVIDDSDDSFNRVADMMARQRVVDYAPRKLSRQEFTANFVGRTWLQAEEQVVDGSPEAATALDYLKTGCVAVRDNWQQQIHDRTNERDALQKLLDNEDMQADEKLAQIKQIVNN